MSVAGSRPEDESVMPLCLRLTHSGGETRHGSMQILATGIGMADALLKCGERQSESQWRVGNMCRIAWSAGAKGWQLTNGSGTLMCVHNGARVRVGTSVVITPGDTLELGLLRFRMEAEAGELVGSSPTSGRASSEHLTGGAPEGGEFRTDAVEDPFRMSGMSGMSGMAGVQARSTADVLAGLLGEVRRPLKRLGAEGDAVQ